MAVVEYGLLVSFTDQSPAYTYGVEFGVIWRRMETEAEPFRAPVRVENRENLTRAGAALNWSVSFADTGVDGWLDGEFSPYRRTTLRLIEPSDAR